MQPPHGKSFTLLQATNIPGVEKAWIHWSGLRPGLGLVWLRGRQQPPAAEGGSASYHYSEDTRFFDVESAVFELTMYDMISEWGSRSPDFRIPEIPRMPEDEVEDSVLSESDQGGRTSVEDARPPGDPRGPAMLVHESWAKNKTSNNTTEEQDAGVETPTSTSTSVFGVTLATAAPTDLPPVLPEGDFSAPTIQTDQFAELLARHPPHSRAHVELQKNLENLGVLPKRGSTSML